MRHVTSKPSSARALPGLIGLPDNAASEGICLVNSDRSASSYVSNRILEIPTGDRVSQTGIIDTPDGDIWTSYSTRSPPVNCRRNPPRASDLPIPHPSDHNEHDSADEDASRRSGTANRHDSTAGRGNQSRQAAGGLEGQRSVPQTPGVGTRTVVMERPAPVL
jgi:hypothetical protein